jgi:hypothetical protein
MEDRDLLVEGLTREAVQPIEGEIARLDVAVDEIVEILVDYIL